jgi:hypothetical protein
MISKRVLLIAAMLLAVSATGAMAASVNVGNFNVALLSIGATDYLNLNANNSWGIVGATVITPTPTPYSTVYNYVKNGYAGGSWNGTASAIQSSPAFADSTVNGFLSMGVMSGDDLINIVGKTTYYGRTVLAADSLIKNTYAGDSNFDGKVTDDDFGLFAYGYQVYGTPDQVNGWVWGDYNYDGKITDDDFGWFANVYLNGGAPMGVLGTPPSAAASAAAVPEPSTIALLVAFATCGLFVSLRKR